MQKFVRFCNFVLQRSNSKLFKIERNCTNISTEKVSKFREKLSSGPSLFNFLQNEGTEETIVSSEVDCPPYITTEKENRKVYIETYGCQMNVNDTEIVNAILTEKGFEIIKDFYEADIIFVMTCAIREGAEQKIWKRLKFFRGLKARHDIISRYPMKIGVLGCMARRLKHNLIEKEKVVDVIAGPDSYKDLPNLLSLADEGQKAVNVMLSVDETYADIMPVRVHEASKSAFVSIMRGCDNMCTYCIVPFTRGRERSRPVSSILDEVKYLSEQGIKEITLLGQNVNSYRDISTESLTKTVLSSGFKTVYKSKDGGLRFAELLSRVASIDPEMRIRFTSPHPKDFPDDVLHVINEKPNICKFLHMPAQSGNSEILHKMRRGYTREAYIELINHVRNIIPSVAFTSDFICGFCDETEEAHKDTLSLIEMIKYEFVYVFAYSMRQRTHAYYDLKDNVPEEVKKRRAEEAHDVFRRCTLNLHQKEIGKSHLIQVLGPSKRSESDWSGRNDWNTKVIYPQVPIPTEKNSTNLKEPSPGEYIVVQVKECSSQVLKGKPLYHTTLQDFNKEQSMAMTLCN